MGFQIRNGEFGVTTGERTGYSVRAALEFVEEGNISCDGLRGEVGSTMGAFGRVWWIGVGLRLLRLGRTLVGKNGLLEDSEEAGMAETGLARTASYGTVHVFCKGNTGSLYSKRCDEKDICAKNCFLRRSYA